MLSFCWRAQLCLFGVWYTASRLFFFYIVSSTNTMGKLFCKWVISAVSWQSNHNEIWFNRCVCMKLVPPFCMHNHKLFLPSFTSFFQQFSYSQSELISLPLQLLLFFFKQLIWPVVIYLFIYLFLPLPNSWVPSFGHHCQFNRPRGVQYIIWQILLSLHLQIQGQRFFSVCSDEWIFIASSSCLLRDIQKYRT